MGRRHPSRGLRPSALRRDERSKRAKETLNIDIPAILKANPRAQAGVSSSQLIREPPVSKNLKSWKQENVQPPDEAAAMKDSAFAIATNVNPVVVRIELADTFQAAYILHKQTKNSKVAVLNMASPLRPGGGFLTGAQAQEESLCMRSTLYPALSESFYRLPEIGGVYTEDILVFRSWDNARTDLPKNQQFYVDVMTAAMPRHPDIETDSDGKQRYANAKDSELVEAKMRKVMSIIKSRAVTKVVLGAWGCGAYKNPLDEVVRLWKKVLLGDVGSCLADTVNSEWSGMELVFAINQKPMAETFAAGFGLILHMPTLSECEETDENAEQTEELSENRELRQKIDQVKSQLMQVRNPDLKARLEEILDGLTTQLSQASMD